MAGANNARVRIIVSVGILLSLCAAWGQQVAQKPTDASAPPKNNTKPTPLVNADQDQAMFLGRVEQLIVEKSYRDAIRLLQQLIDKAEGFFRSKKRSR